MKPIENKDERLVLRTGRSWLCYALLAAAAYGLWVAATAATGFADETRRALAALFFIGLALGALWVFPASTFTFDRGEGRVAIHRDRGVRRQTRFMPLGAVTGPVVREKKGKLRRAFLAHDGGETALTTAYRPGAEAREVADLIEGWLDRA